MTSACNVFSFRNTVAKHASVLFTYVFCIQCLAEPGGYICVRSGPRVMFPFICLSFLHAPEKPFYSPTKSNMCHSPTARPPSRESQGIRRELHHGKRSHCSVVLQQPREPLSFRDPPMKSWKSGLQVERVRSFNRCDDEGTFCHALFYLEDAARTWFENHKSSQTD